MKSLIKNILKEAQDYHSSVFLIMSEDERFVKYNLHVAGENYFSGGPNEDGWESVDKLNNKTFQEFYINQRKNAEGVVSILPQPQLDRYKPKVVEYVMGFFRKDSMSNVFDQLTESKEGIGSKRDPHRGDFILAKKAIFVDGKDRATTMGNMYEIKKIRNEYGIINVIFINDFDAEHTVTPTNHFFEEYFEYVPREYKEGLENTDTLFDTLFEDWTIEPKPNEPKLTGIDLSDLTEGEKREVLKKLEDNFGVFSNFHNYAWVDRIEYLVTDFKTPYTLGDRENQIGLWFDSKEGFRRLTGGGYFVTVRMDGKKLIWREEISGREFLDTNFDLTHNFFNINESEFDDLEWANDVVTDSSRIPSVGVVYRVNLPKDEKAIIDILIADMDENWVRDNTRAIIIDPETIVDPKRFLRDYNRNFQTPLDRVIELLEEGYWRPIPKEMSLFRQEDFDPNDPIYIPRLTESEEDNFEWVRNCSQKYK